MSQASLNRPVSMEQYMPGRETKVSNSQLNPVEDLQRYLIQYAKEQPQKAALWCFGIGFIVGWKLKPW